MERPTTKYARYRDLHVAYQTLGVGPPDIVFVAPMYTHLEAMWEQPEMARYLRRLAGMGRLVLFDAIGTGLSDPLPELRHSLDSWATDVRIVMDAVGIERAVIHSFDSAGEMAMLFAAQYPDRVKSLVLVTRSPACNEQMTFPSVSPTNYGNAISTFGETIGERDACLPCSATLTLTKVNSPRSGV